MGKGKQRKSKERGKVSRRRAKAPCCRVGKTFPHGRAKIVVSRRAFLTGTTAAAISVAAGAFPSVPVSDAAVPATSAIKAALTDALEFVAKWESIGRELDALSAVLNARPRPSGGPEVEHYFDLAKDEYLAATNAKWKLSSIQKLPAGTEGERALQATAAAALADMNKKLADRNAAWKLKRAAEKQAAALAKIERKLARARARARASKTVDQKMLSG